MIELKNIQERQENLRQKVYGEQPMGLSSTMRIQILEEAMEEVIHEVGKLNERQAFSILSGKHTMN